MNNINYTGKWALDISNMSEAEWDQLVSICESKGIEVYNKEYSRNYNYLSCKDNNAYTARSDGYLCTKVTLLQMLNLLETPTKSASQIKIDELQQTIKLANDQIEALKEL
jgi:hypothetical protein